MPEKDAGDVFLRHRGAVLDALLTEPASPVAAELETSEPDLGVPFGADTEPMGPPTPEQRRSAGGPKASDRILALLNGTVPESASALDFSAEFPDLAEHGMAASRSAGPVSEATEQADSRRQAPAEGLAGKALTYLKNPKIALPLGAALVILLIVALVNSGGKNKEDSDRLPVVAQSAVPTTSKPPLSGAAAPGAIIPVKSAESHCPPGGTPGMDAFGGQQGKAWACERAFKVDGQVLTIDLGKSYTVDSIGIVPGWDSVSADGVDQWQKYRTVSRVSYQLDGAKTRLLYQQTLDQRTLVVTKIDPPVSTTRIILTVLASKGDPTINTVAISSIVITGH
ncbi:discoidin domain-containing protein [Nocardia sp. NPDC057030]|uniref:discoidin domain-containing protein n=1 Tax=unclassified Nocardia TaxID=2637762 RepID=UPI00362D8C6E